MSRIVRTLAALLSMGVAGEVVQEGATLHAAAGYDVRLLSSLPDADGLITVQGFPQKVKPEDVGLYFRPASLSIMDMTEAQAVPVVAAYQQETPPPPALAIKPTWPTDSVLLEAPPAVAEKAPPDFPGAPPM
jgi:hypothetical protein